MFNTRYKINIIIKCLKHKKLQQLIHIFITLHDVHIHYYVAVADVGGFIPKMNGWLISNKVILTYEP